MLHADWPRARVLAEAQQNESCSETFLFLSLGGVGEPQVEYLDEAVWPPAGQKEIKD